MLQATLPEIKLALSSKSRDLLSHVISECMQMRGRILLWSDIPNAVFTFKRLQWFKLTEVKLTERK